MRRRSCFNSLGEDLRPGRAWSWRGRGHRGRCLRELSEPTHRLSGEHAGLYAHTHAYMHTHPCTLITTCHIPGLSTHSLLRPPCTHMDVQHAFLLAHIQLDTDLPGANPAFSGVQICFPLHIGRGPALPSKRGSPAAVSPVECPGPTAWAPSTAPAPGL